MGVLGKILALIFVFCVMFIGWYAYTHIIIPPPSITNSSNTSLPQLMSHKVFPNTTPVDSINLSVFKAAHANLAVSGITAVGNFSNTELLYKINNTLYWIPESFNTTFSKYGFYNGTNVNNYWQNFSYLNGKKVELAIGTSNKITNTTPITYINATFDEVNNTYNFYVIRNVANTTTANYYKLITQPSTYFLYGFKYGTNSFYNFTLGFPLRPVK